MTGDPIVLEVVGVPAPQGSKTKTRFGVIEGSSATGRASLAEWRRAVADTARIWVYQHNALPLAEPVRVSIVFRFQLPAGDQYRTLHCTKPDIDKTVRSTFDALVHGGLLADDSRVCSLSAEKRYARPGETVGATVEVEPLGWYEAQQRDRLKTAAAESRRTAKAAS